MRGHVRQQRLRGADVAGGLFAADVLLARAERQAQRGFAARILGDADDAAGHLAFEFVARGEKRRVRPAVAQRHAKPLRAADGDVRAKFARRLEQRQRQQIRGHGQQRAGGVGFFGKAGVIVNRAERVGILHQRAENLFGELEIFVIADDDFDAQRLGARPDDFDVLRMAVFGDEERRSGPSLSAMAHRHRLGGGGGFVEQRGVGDVERRSGR